MGLEYNKPIEWEGSFVAFGESTFNDKITLTSISGKEATKDFESGATLFQGVKEIKKELKITKLKFMLENVKAVKDKVTIKGGAIGSVRNCPDFDSLDCSENVELRIVNSTIKKTVKVDTGQGEIISSTIEGKTTLDKASFFVSNMSLFKKEDNTPQDLDTTSSFLTINKLNMGKLTANKAFIDIDDIIMIKLTATESYIDVDKVNIVNGDLIANKTFMKICNLTAKDLSITESCDIAIHKATTNNMTVRNSELALFNINSKLVNFSESEVQAYSLTATKIETSITNFWGSDIVSDCVLSNSTTNFLTLIGDASLSNSTMSVHAMDGSASIDNSSSLVGLSSLVSVSTSGAVLLLNSLTNVSVNDHGFIGIGCVGSSNFSSINGGVDIFAVERINNRTNDDFIAAADSSAYMTAESDLLCQAGGTMNLIAGSKQLVKGSQVYVVGASVPQFSPNDHCTSGSCGKPVWKAGSTGQSVELPD